LFLNEKNMCGIVKNSAGKADKNYKQLDRYGTPDDAAF